MLSAIMISLGFDGICAQYIAIVSTQQRARMRISTASSLCSDYVTIAFLLEQGADIHMRNTQLAMAIYLTARKGDISLTRLLLRYRASLTCKDHMEYTYDPITPLPLFLAIHMDHHTTVYMLMQKLSYLEIYDTELSQTFLHYALTYDMHNSMMLLLEAGAEEPQAQDVPYGTCRKLLKQLRTL